MKKILIAIFLLSFLSYASAAEEENCKTALAKLKPECAEWLKKFKSFSKANQTIDKSLENAGIIEKKQPGEKSRPLKKLKEIAQENKTVDQTIDNLKKKPK